MDKEVMIMAKKKYKKKYEKNVGFGDYFLIGLLVMILSFIILLPVNFLTVILAVFSGALLTIPLLIAYIIIAIAIEGFVIVKVVQNRGWKKVR